MYVTCLFLCIFSILFFLPLLFNLLSLYIVYPEKQNIKINVLLSLLLVLLLKPQSIIFDYMNKSHLV